jgi:integrase
MRGTVYRACWCRDPETGKPYHARCPKLKRPDHGKWYARYETEGIGGRRRQPVLGPFRTKDEAEGELAKAVADVGGGGTAPDRSVKIGDYLDTYLEGKRNLKPRSKETDEEAFRLYWKPAIGHMRLVDVRDRHVSMVISAMELINVPVPENAKREVIEMLRRMIAARADDVRRVLPEGEQRRKKSTKPLSPARIERMYAPFRSAMNAAIPKTIKYSPCAGVELPRVDKDRPLPWTPQRVAAFRAALGKRMAARQEELGGRTLTVVDKQDLWGAPDLRPSRVMVWMPADTGTFLDSIAEERLSPLYTLTAYCGLRRDEVLGLDWTEVDLDEGSADVLETGSGSGPKSESGKRTVPLPGTGRGRAARVAGTAGSRTAHPGSGPGRHGPRVHLPGRKAPQRPVRLPALRSARLPGGAAAHPVPRSAPRRGQPGEGRRPGHQVHQRAARPQPDLVHGQDLRHAVPGNHEERGRGGCRGSPPEAGQCRQEPAARPLTSVRALCVHRASGGQNGHHARIVSVFDKS